jgi:hypothetical protein
VHLHRTTRCSLGEYAMEVRPTHYSEAIKSEKGTLHVALFGDITITHSGGKKLRRSGNLIARFPVCGERSPMIINGRVVIPMIHVDAPKNRSTATKSNRDVVLSNLLADTRGAVQTAEKPNVAHIQIHFIQPKSDGGIDSSLLIPAIVVILPVRDKGGVMNVDEPVEKSDGSKGANGANGEDDEGEDKGEDKGEGEFGAHDYENADSEDSENDDAGSSMENDEDEIEDLKGGANDPMDVDGDVDRGDVDVGGDAAMGVSSHALQEDAEGAEGARKTAGGKKFSIACCFKVLSPAGSTVPQMKKRLLEHMKNLVADKSDYVFIEALGRTVHSIFRPKISEEEPEVKNALPVCTSGIEEPFEYLASLLLRGLEVYFNKRAVDAPRSAHEYQGIAYTMISETIISLRIAVSTALRKVVNMTSDIFGEKNNFTQPTRRQVSHIDKNSVGRSLETFTEAMAAFPKEITVVNENQEYIYTQPLLPGWKVVWVADDCRDAGDDGDGGDNADGGDGGDGHVEFWAKDDLDGILDRLGSMAFLESVYTNAMKGDRKDPETLQRRRQFVVANLGEALYFATMVIRHVSPHDPRERWSQPRDDGFIDGRDTTDSNPGHRGFLSISALLSRRVPHGLMKTVIAKAAEDFKRLNPGRIILEPKPLGDENHWGRILLSGSPMFYYVVDYEEALEKFFRCELLKAAKDESLFHEVSVEIESRTINITGMPERLIRPVQILEVPLDSKSTWLELLNEGKIKYLSQDEQTMWHVAATKTDLTDHRTAFEIDPDFRCGYRVMNVNHRANGHPSRLHYYMKFQSAAAGFASLLPGTGCRWIGPHNVQETSANPTLLNGMPGNSSACVVLSWGNTGGTNHEDSLPVNRTFLSTRTLYKDHSCSYGIKFGDALPRSEITRVEGADFSAIGEDTLPFGFVKAGQPMMVFQRSAAKYSSESESYKKKKEQTIWKAPITGCILAARKDALGNHTVVVRVVLPLTPGSKVAFEWQKMTVTLHADPVSSSWMPITAVSHPCSMLSRSSPGLLKSGLLNVAAAGRAVGWTLVAYGTDGEALRALSNSNGSVELWNYVVGAPDVPHTLEAAVFHEVTGVYLGRMIHAILRSPQAPQHDPRLAISGRCSERCESKGPKQEPLLSNIHSAGGFSKTEEHSPDSVWTGCSNRLSSFEVCGVCSLAASNCNCESQKESGDDAKTEAAMFTVRIAQETQMAVELSESAGMQIRFEIGAPIPSFETSEKESTQMTKIAPSEKGRPVKAGEIVQAAIEQEKASRTTVAGKGTMTIEDDENARNVILKGKGARVIGSVLMYNLRERGILALTDAENGSNIGVHSEFKFRIEACGTAESQMKGLQFTLVEFLGDIQKVKTELNLSTNTSSDVRFEISATTRTAANIVRIWARDLLQVKRFVLGNNFAKGFRDGSGRLLPMPCDELEDTQLERWREAHYEHTALAEILTSVPIADHILVGPCVMTIPDVTVPFVNANVLKIGDKNASAYNMDILPRPPSSGISDEPITLDGEVVEESPMEGSPFSVLPSARFNSVWEVVVDDISVLKKNKKAADFLLGETVCHAGLLSPQMLATMPDEGSFILVDETKKCTGCGACVSLANDIPVDLEDMQGSCSAVMNPRKVDDHAARLRDIRLPFKKQLRLVESKKIVALEASSGSSEVPVGPILLKAAGEIINTWFAETNKFWTK